MNYLEQAKRYLEKPPIDNELFPSLDLSFDEDYSVIVCGKTETAIKWAEKFLKHGFVTAIQFEEIPEELLPYRLNIRYKSDDLNKGERLGTKIIGVIATGDPELDQILAVRLNEMKAIFIMSETFGRFVNKRLPGDNSKQAIEGEINSDEDDKTIKLGIFEDELDSDSMKSRLEELKSNFPDFHFKEVVLNKYDSEKYGLDYYKYFNLSLQDIINNSYNRGFNALFKDDVDLVLVNGRDVPIHYSKEIDFWPTLIEREQNRIVAIMPKEKSNNFLEWPDEQKVYVSDYEVGCEFKSVFTKYHFMTREFRYPKVQTLDNLKDFKNIYEKEHGSIFITNFNEFLANLDWLVNFFQENNLRLAFLPLTPVTLDGFTIGLSRKDNQSKALELLKVASQKINSDQTDMFMLESVYKNRTAPYFKNTLDGFNNGGFIKFDENQYGFRGYAEMEERNFVKTDIHKMGTFEEATEDMFEFIDCISDRWQLR